MTRRSHSAGRPVSPRLSCGGPALSLPAAPVAGRGMGIWSKMKEPRRALGDGGVPC